MNTKKTEECLAMLRKLVSEMQGAPYPGDNINLELYRIWYEHAQETAVSCFEFLHGNFPEDTENITKNIDELLV